MPISEVWGLRWPQHLTYVDQYWVILNIIIIYALYPNETIEGNQIFVRGMYGPYFMNIMINPISLFSQVVGNKWDAAANQCRVSSMWSPLCQKRSVFNFESHHCGVGYIQCGVSSMRSCLHSMRSLNDAELPTSSAESHQSDITVNQCGVSSLRSLLHPVRSLNNAEWPTSSAESHRCDITINQCGVSSMWSCLHSVRSLINAESYLINAESHQFGFGFMQCGVSSMRSNMVPVSYYYYIGFYYNELLFKYYRLLRQDGWRGNMSQQKIN